MRKTDLTKNKQIPELEEMIAHNREELRKIRFGLYSGKIKNVKSSREIKKDIARLLTAISDLKK